MTEQTETRTDLGTAAAAIAPLLVRTAQKRAAEYGFLGAGISGTCLIGAVETGGVFSAFEVMVEPEAGVPPHIHSHEDETFYILDGRFEVQIGEKAVEIIAGMALHAPRGVAHGFRCTSEMPGRGLVITTPGGFEDFFAELNEAASDLQAPGEAAFARIGELMEKYGMRPAASANLPKRGVLPGGAFLGLGDHRVQVLVSSQNSGGAIALGIIEVDPQGGPPPHRHHREDEAFYILEGRFAILIDDETTEAGPGDFLFAPRNSTHGWKNIGETPAYALALVTPAANFEGFAREMEGILARSGGDMSVIVSTLALREEMMGIFRRHDIEPVQPAAAIK